MINRSYFGAALALLLLTHPVDAQQAAATLAPVSDGPGIGARGSPAAPGPGFAGSTPGLVAAGPVAPAPPGRLLVNPAATTPGQTSPRPSTPSPVGVWLTQDHDGVIAVTQCADRLCARIVGVVLDHPNDAMPVDYRGTTQCNLTLISDAKEVRPGLWKGHILDPRNGNRFGADLHMDPHGQLALRGFLGIPLLGSTETWTRYTGIVPPDCRLVAALH